MRRLPLLYTALVAVALLAITGIPFLVHERGSSSVPGWQGLINPGPLSRVHQPFSGRCETCHSPHVGVEPKNCLACHRGVNFADKPSTRFHADATQCTSCHVEHDGGGSLTRMDHKALLDPSLWRGPGFFRLSAGGRPEANPLNVLNCAACHSTRDPHQGFFGQNCAACHTLESWTVASFRHPPPSSRACAECHKPPKSHLMGHFEMVSRRVAGNRARVDQCYACHLTDGWNNIRGRGLYDHH